MSYEIVLEVNSQFSIGFTSKNCRDLGKIILMNFGDNHLANSVPGVASKILTLKELLGYITARTLSFGKIFEHIRYSDIVKPDPKACYTPCITSRATVASSLTMLHEAGLIIMFHSQSKRDLYIGLDIYNVVVKLFGLYKKPKESKYNRITYSADSLRAVIQSKTTMKMLKGMQNLNGFSLPKDSSQITREVIALAKCPSAAEIAKAWEPRLDAKMEAKTASLEETDFFELIRKSGQSKISTPNVKNFLALWNKIVRDSELYPAFRGEKYKQTDEGIISKYLLSECESGISFREFKADLKAILYGWGRLPKSEQWISIVKQNGETASMNIRTEPNLYLFCRHSEVIGTVCRKYSTYRGDDIYDNIVPKTEGNIQTTSAKASVDF